MTLEKFKKSLEEIEELENKIIEINSFMSKLYNLNANRYVTVTIAADQYEKDKKMSLDFYFYDLLEITKKNIFKVKKEYEEKLAEVAKTGFKLESRFNERFYTDY